MTVKTNQLPNLILLEDFNGDWHSYISAVYDIFKKDLVINKPVFRGIRLGLKRHPIIDGKEYTFYHMTHEGVDEKNRVPDIRRCERIPWAKPTIENCDSWKLKVWVQIRKREQRICIWLERESEPDYLIVLAKRKDYLLPWTAFTLEFDHQRRKKQREYEAYKKAEAAHTDKSG